jgi:hypothetical protein
MPRRPGQHSPSWAKASPRLVASRSRSRSWPRSSSPSSSPHELDATSSLTVTQVMTGFFVGTFGYALVVLRVVHGPTPSKDAFVPTAGISVANLLRLVSLVVLLVFFHHMVRTVQVAESAASRAGFVQGSRSTTCPRGWATAVHASTSRSPRAIRNPQDESPRSGGHAVLPTSSAAPCDRRSRSAAAATSSRRPALGRRRSRAYACQSLPRST